jgi:hypothetical protein
VPDISAEALAYLDEAVAAYFADCLLACCVMVGVAAEAEFLRLVDVAANSKAFGLVFAPAVQPVFIRQKITKFQECLKLNPHGVTVKVPELVAVPPGVVTAILPVLAPVGTVTVICESEFTVNVVALTPPNVTFDA